MAPASAETRPWTVQHAAGPLVATAIHAGHELRPEVARHIVLTSQERLREEDPYTDGWVGFGDSTIVVHRSRFEVDLNRDRDACVYATPEQCWGLELWRGPLPPDVAERSRRLHDAFYDELFELLVRVERSSGRFVVIDVHSYNHRRDGPGSPPADQAGNPDVNVGTGSVDERWRPLVDRYIEALRDWDGGTPLDVRENVRFRGAHLVRWVNACFPVTGCGLAIEVKKIFMDEHTGELDTDRWEQIGKALAAAGAAVRSELAR